MAKLTPQQDRLAELLLQTLSLYEAYTFQRLMIELDKDFVEENEKLTIEDLEQVVKKLSKQKKVIISKNSYQEKTYQRAFPKRNLRSRLKRWWAGQ